MLEWLGITKVEWMLLLAMALIIYNHYLLEKRLQAIAERIEKLIELTPIPRTY